MRRTPRLVLVLVLVLVVVGAGEGRVERLHRAFAELLEVVAGLLERVARRRREAVALGVPEGLQ
jgi:hypothetical protein